MNNINELTYEVWYKSDDKITTRRLAAFHFRFEAEKYIEMFHSKEKEKCFIVVS